LSGPKDVVLAQTVRSLLDANRQLGACMIKVKAQDGAIWLSGRVNTPGERAVAEQIARSVVGVRNVINELTVS